MISSISNAFAISKQHPQRNHDVITRISTGSDAKECINAYLNLKQDREAPKLEKLLKNLLKKESLTQNDTDRTKYRQALVAIHECAQERTIDINRLIEVLPIEDLDKGIILPQIMQLTRRNNPQYYLSAIVRFKTIINDSDISTEKKIALLNSIETQLNIAIQFCIIKSHVFFYKHATKQLNKLNLRKINNITKINAIKQLQMKYGQKPQQTQRGITLLKNKIEEIENAIQTITEYKESCLSNFELWKQWKADPLSIDPNNLPQIPVEFPDVPIIHQLEGITP